MEEHREEARPRDHVVVEHEDEGRLGGERELEAAKVLEVVLENFLGSVVSKGVNYTYKVDLGAVFAYNSAVDSIVEAGIKSIFIKYK